MTSYAAALLDKARITCSPANYNALALRLGVTRQSVSSWRHGVTPLPEERVRELARIAHVDEAEWWLAVQSDSAPEAMKPKLRAVLHKAGIAALLAIAAGPAMASHFAYSGLLMPIMSTVRAALTRLRRTLERRRSAPDACLLAL